MKNPRHLQTVARKLQSESQAHSTNCHIVKTRRQFQLRIADRNASLDEWTVVRCATLFLWF